MKKLSVIIPSRDEKFLTKTIDDVFAKCRGECEVVAVLDSDKWPIDWKEVSDRHPNLTTIHNGTSIGMRGSINKGVGSARSRGAKYVMKLDGHVMLDEGFDVKLLETIENNWIVIPRRKRLDADNWVLTDVHKPDVDYHYLSFPDDPNDFGGPGLNGKIWPERALARKDVLIDDEMSSQGSAWLCAVDYFYELELMDEQAFGPFWCEAQEVLMKAWLSGGRCVVNKNTWYAHLHKGKVHGRGYHLPEKWLTQGRNQAMKWPWNEAWSKQTLPFKWLIEKFWPVPTWPENWREVLYAERKPRIVGVLAVADSSSDSRTDIPSNVCEDKLTVHAARYGISDTDYIDVRERLKSLAKDGDLDFIINNSTLTPGQNPFRGKKKHLTIEYSFGMGGERITRTVEEKDWLIIGPSSPTETMLDQAQKMDALMTVLAGDEDDRAQKMVEAAFGKEGARTMLSVFESQSGVRKVAQLAPDALPMTASALNDYLIRRFQVSPQRLRGPMPIELRDFHRNDLAQLFAELGFKRGAEIGVAEGNYSEVLLKANPECELLLVDPWHHYSDNPQNKSKEKHEFAKNEVIRKLTKYKKRITLVPFKSMDALYKGEVDKDSLDFCYIDGNHLFDYVMQDLIEWSKRVRSGGVVSGDDYFQLDQKRWVGGGVVEAVQAYVNAHRIPVWYLFTGHKSVDFMWVKP